MVLPFGAKSSPYLFDQFAKGLEYVMKCKGVSCVEHYLDDYFTCGPSDTNVCQNNLNIMKVACTEMGFEINPSKLDHPSTEIEFLGIIIDSNRMQLRISNDRLSDIYNELIQWNNKKCTTKRQLLSIIGKLTFVSKVVRSGRTFVRRMIDLSKRVKHLHHKIKLNTGFREDIKWWLNYLYDWNGINMFHDENWFSNYTINIYTDSSRAGIGCLYKNHWIMEPFKQYGFAMCQTITWKELFAIVRTIACHG